MQVALVVGPYGRPRGRAAVAPTMEWLAEEFLVHEPRARLGEESLLTDPIVHTLDADALSRYELRVLVR